MRASLTLADLLDARFERRFGPVLVRWLYVGSLTFAAGLALFGVLMSWWLASWAGWGFWLGAPLSMTGGLVCAFVVRLVCEQLIRWTGPELARRAYATPAPAGASPPPSSHP